MPFYILALILFFSNTVFAQQKQIPDGTPIQIQMQKQSNTHTWVPASSGPGSGITFKSGAGVSDVSPKVTGQLELPYTHKAANARLTMNAPLNKTAISNAATAAVAGAAAGGLASGSPHVAVGALALGIMGPPLIEYLVGLGVDYFTDDGAGNILYSIPLTDGLFTSDGGVWSSSLLPGSQFFSSLSLCSAILELVKSSPPENRDSYIVSHSLTCNIWRSAPGYGLGTFAMSRSGNSSCPVGNYINVSGTCFDAPPKEEKPLSDIAQTMKRAMDDHWNSQFAAIAAGVISMGIVRDGNLFTDDISITGPAAVPISETTGTWPVNVLPGTTTPAPAGHTGPTDSGTRTETTTTTAQNTFNQNKMTTTTKSQTSSSVTNNVTNITSTTNITNTTETDKAPEEEKKDFCEKNPKAVSCAELDEPEKQDIPKRSVEITYAPEDLGFGRGSCPADRVIGDQTFSYQPTCDLLNSYAYPLTLLLATFGALCIIFVGRADA